MGLPGFVPSLLRLASEALRTASQPIHSLSESVRQALWLAGMRIGRPPPLRITEQPVVDSPFHFDARTARANYSGDAASDLGMHNPLNMLARGVRTIESFVSKPMGVPPNRRRRRYHPYQRVGRGRAIPYEFQSQAGWGYLQ